MIWKVLVAVDQRAIVYKDGRIQGLLMPGKYRFVNGDEVGLVSTAKAFIGRYHLEDYRAVESIARELEIVEVGDAEIVAVFESGNIKQILTPGTYAFWKTAIKREFRTYDLSAPIIPEDVTPVLATRAVMAPYVQSAEVASYEAGLLFYDGTYQGVLTPGKYYFWDGPVKVTLEKVDRRQLQLEVTGQEVMTRDKATLRLNFTAHYKIVQPELLYANIKDYKTQLHVVLQLVLREYIGRLKLDELLERKEEVGPWVLARVAADGAKWGVEFQYAGVKDIVLPGEIKEILNKVLEAEKKAQANVITRREETASTRSLLNTAKLMEDNPVLLRLKEMEYVENISARIGQLNLTGRESVLSELTTLFGRLS